MNKGLLNIILTAVVFAALAGCSTVPVQQLSEKYDPPILSAAQARSMIRVEVTKLEPIVLDETVVASASLDHLR
ncbi:MAG: hypothetical protein WBN07_14940 [Woeseiaceae bacterium]